MTKKAEDKTGPMDDSVKEATVGTAATNAPRQCWALKTLVSEVQILFPETPYEVSNIDGRNTALDVQFDLTTLDSQERADLIVLLLSLDEDPRVAEVMGEDGLVLISFKSNALTQDDRTPFGLADAYQILIEESDPVESSEEDFTSWKIEGSL